MSAKTRVMHVMKKSRRDKVTWVFWLRGSFSYVLGSFGYVGLSVRRVFWLPGTFGHEGVLITEIFWLRGTRLRGSFEERNCGRSF